MVTAADVGFEYKYTINVLDLGEMAESDSGRLWQRRWTATIEIFSLYSSSEL